MRLNYWEQREIDTQNAIANKTIEETEKQLHKYYKKAMDRVITDFEDTFNKLVATVAADRDITPADLYKLDRYWKMQAQLKVEMQKLGDKEIKLLSRKFEQTWKYIYEVASLPSDIAFSTISTSNAKSMINSIWLADGKNFSQRVWKNTEKLVETLNDELMNCVITGKKASYLREKLQERFDVSRNQANTLIKTEVAHIQTEAAIQRYKDYGLTKYKFFADTDERTCRHNKHGESCKDLDGKIFLYSEKQAGVNAPPMHPNCRCCIIPVIEKTNINELKE